MKIFKTHILVILPMLALAGIVTGCGPSKAEREAKERERQRLEYEEKQRQEAAAANKAITEMNQRMFSRPRANSIDLGVPPPETKPPSTTPATPVNPAPPAPAPQSPAPTPAK
jgi:hypothetical protein